MALIEPRHGRAIRSWLGLRRIAGADRQASPLANAIYIILLIVPALSMLGYLFPPINHDAGAVLDVSSRWLAGERLYVEVIDINTPLVFLIYAIPVVLADWFSVDATTMLTLCLIAGIVVAFIASRRVLDLASAPDRPLTEALLPVMLLFLLALFPNDMFGQREHIMLIAAVPYLLLSGLRADGGPSSRGLGFAIALCAGIGFALKPHFMIMPALIESYLIHRHGWSRQLRDIVPWTIGLVAVAHAIFAVLVTPEYFTFVLPLVLRYYTELGDVEMIGMLLGSVLAPTILALVPLSAAALFMLRSRLGVVLALFAIGTVASAALQAKGWSYHSLPALSATLLLAAVVIGGVLDRYLPLEKINQPMPIAVITASLMMLVFYQSALFNPPFRNQRGFEDSVAVRLEHVIEQYADNKRILVLSPGIYPHFPVFNYTGARNAMRFESLWLLQGIYADCEEFAPLYNPIESMSIAEQFVFRAVAEDFARVRPSLVIIDRVAGIPRCQARAFDYLEYFQRNPLFAKTFQAYTPLMDLERYTIYWRG